MFIVFGLNRKKHYLSTRQTICTACGRQTGLNFILVKRALHFFWIPFLPAGSRIYMKCATCSKEWKVSDAPLDISFLAFASIAFMLLIGTFYLAIASAPIPIWWLTGFMNIGVSGMYLFYLPAQFRGYPSEAGTFQPSSYAAQPWPNRTNRIAPATSQVSANELYAKDYAARRTCPGCGRKYETTLLSSEAGCPYCGTKG